MLYPLSYAPVKSMTYSNSERIRALVQQFIQKRKYLLGVTPKTIIWYGCGFKAFEGAMESREAVNQRIVELRERKIHPITTDGYLRILMPSSSGASRTLKFRS
jgi:hypothetical protein